ncbi:hypothetical protein BCV69DRAFT_279401 [Microstroma glucosiphilum]|uniref:CCHC-type domain-containing protein n=1 Tax=Pseudomicrostroma glucosiphilum TaxID=1684307 RepID=A0A316TVU0_9BASI|nr:hypothetical protein BCV69DRAFT_279401 [Pseudomicrostroma glucosiphilum]PWN17659.1 hypothetical protein BCV69DRAFT_279401 [Pseudomicrostroma glucosiphilum]
MLVAEASETEVGTMKSGKGRLYTSPDTSPNTSPGSGPRGRPVIILRASALAKDHEVRTSPTAELHEEIAAALHRTLKIKPLAMRRLTSGNLAVELNIASEALHQATDIGVKSCRWLIGAGRRDKSHGSSVLMGFATEDDRGAIRNRGRLGIHNEVAYLDDYRPRPRIDQCTKCQQYGHKIENCKSAVPSCRLRALPHLTQDHTDCDQCED